MDDRYEEKKEILKEAGFVRNNPRCQWELESPKTEISYMLVRHLSPEELKRTIQPLSGAIISPCGKYRYQLWRTWDSSKPPAVFIMLNPSTADALQDDPTIRRCIGFAKAWGLGGIKVVNVFAYRATDPKELKHIIDPVGEDNQEHILDAVINAGIIILAWGSSGPRHRYAYDRIYQALDGVECYTLGTTKDGTPRHPLYLSGKTMPKRFERRGA